MIFAFDPVGSYDCEWHGMEERRMLCVHAIPPDLSMSSCHDAPLEPGLLTDERRIEFLVRAFMEVVDLMIGGGVYEEGDIGCWSMNGEFGYEG